MTRARLLSASADRALILTGGSTRGVSLDEARAMGLDPDALAPVPPAEPEAVPTPAAAVTPAAGPAPPAANPRDGAAAGGVERLLAPDAAEGPDPESPPDDADYDARPGIRWTRLAMMRRSPRHYMSGAKSSTQSLQRGTLVHCMVLEPEQVERRFAVWTDRRGTNAYRAFVAASGGRTVVTGREFEAARTMAMAIRNHVSGGVRIGALIDECAKETVVEWTDPSTGLACKAKIDAYHTTTNTIWDIKTLRDIEPRVLGNAVHRYGYHAQLAHYADGMHRSGMCAAPPRCGLIVVEVDSLDVGQIDITETDQAAGLKLRDELLARVAECTASGEWPGLYPERGTVMLPAYAYADAELDFTGANE